ncbi:MAG: PHP domain-containing protein, partial [Sandaracinaceae bacterium]|nr:PHP domain-containing protein [Sandaracinaceae bacterium]
MGQIKRYNQSAFPGAAAYAELHARSAFSMLDGAALPETLARRAAELGLSAIALTDLDDVGGAVRFAEACAEHGVRPIFGAELSLAEAGRAPVVLLCEDLEGWSNLCTLITRARADSPRGEPASSLERLAARARGLVCLGGGTEGAVARSPALAGPLAEIFAGRFYLEVHDHARHDDARRGAETIALARRLGVPWVVTSDARHASHDDKLVHDALRCLLHERTLASAGELLFPNASRRVRSPSALASIFAGAPEGLARTLEVAERAALDLVRDARFSLPQFQFTDGTVAGDDHLAALAREGLRERGSTSAHEAQLAHELAVVRRLGLAGFFLVVWDLVRFARSRAILAQGRGSAANSVLCYALGITAVDPVRGGLLFERFLSEGRAGAPDVDLDVAHRDREEVLQYLYARWGREHAAMVCETIAWRAKSAVRDAARVLGLSAELGDRLAREVASAVAHDGPR